MAGRAAVLEGKAAWGMAKAERVARAVRTAVARAAVMEVVRVREEAAPMAKAVRAVVEREVRTAASWEVAARAKAVGVRVEAAPMAKAVRAVEGRAARTAAARAVVATAREVAA